MQTTCRQQLRKVNASRRLPGTASLLCGLGSFERFMDESRRGAVVPEPAASSSSRKANRSQGRGAKLGSGRPHAGRSPARLPKGCWYVTNGAAVTTVREMRRRKRCFKKSAWTEATLSRLLRAATRGAQLPKPTTGSILENSRQPVGRLGPCSLRRNGLDARESRGFHEEAC